MLLRRHQHYSMFGRFYRFPQRSKFSKNMFHPRQRNISLDDVSECFVIDSDTGEALPMYLVVPCNHCNVCKGSKINSFVHRCKLESQMYDSLPWFCTFTYDDEHLPSDGVSVLDMQKFMKRLRINLKREGFNFSPRYVIVGEYGKNTHRAHYHGLFWNINSRNEHDYLKVSAILERSWSKGFVMHRLVDLSDDKGYYYTSKYLKKDCIVPAGKNPCFMLSSRGKGGIGSRFIDKVAPQVRKSLNPEFKFLNKWNGKVENLTFCSYVLNRIFPSFCRSVKKDFRDAWQKFLEFYGVFKKRFPDYEDKFYSFYRSFRERVSNYLYSPAPVPSLYGDGWQSVSLVCALRCLSDAKDVLEASLQTDLLPLYKSYQDKRTLFISKLGRVIVPQDIGVKSFNLGRSFSLASAREIL